MSERITLAHGSGGKEMDDLIASYAFGTPGAWKGTDDDGAIFPLGRRKVVFTTDSFIVDPIFFPGGDIGHLAFSGTVNDLLVMGSDPLGLSLSFIIEEGFPLADLDRILSSLRQLSQAFRIPIVTGDTKVMEKGKVDKLIINTSGIGERKTDLRKPIVPGDKIIISGGLGEHAVALLSKRYDYTTSLISDTKPLVEEMQSIREFIKTAKDPTRGGIASALNMLSAKNRVGMTIHEPSIPVRDEVKTVVKMLGIGLYDLASEGRLICISSPNHAKKVVDRLKRFNPDASIIGEVTEGDHVVMATVLGTSILPVPTGRIVPRIC